MTSRRLCGWDKVSRRGSTGVSSERCGTAGDNVNVGMCCHPHAWLLAEGLCFCMRPHHVVLMQTNMARMRVYAVCVGHAPSLALSQHMPSTLYSSRLAVPFYIFDKHLFCIMGTYDRITLRDAGMCRTQGTCPWRSQLFSEASFTGRAHA